MLLGDVVGESMQVAHLTEAALYVVDVDLNVVLERTENQPKSSVNFRDLMCIDSGCLKFVFMSMLYLTRCKLKKINRNVYNNTLISCKKIKNTLICS